MLQEHSRRGVCPYGELMGRWYLPTLLYLMQTVLLLIFRGKNVERREKRERKQRSGVRQQTAEGGD